MNMAMFVEVRNAVDGMKAGLMMVLVQAAFAGVNVFYKLAANDGMNLTVIIAYRFVFATAFMVPMALVFERRKKGPKLTWWILVQAFFCGLLGGSMGQNMYLESLALTSATYASAITNLIPAITFILAVIFGMEKLGVATMAGKAKVAGTLIGIGGAMVLTFYKGMEIDIWSTHINLLHHDHVDHGQARPSYGNPILGSLLAASGCTGYAGWLIIQAKMSERYPYPYTTTALMMFMASVQAVAYAVIRERDGAQWRLGWNIRLLAVSYTGIVGSGVSYALVTWCVRMKGPLFTSIFNPLMVVMVAFMGSIILDESLHLGSILGAGLIVCGLYMVLWGKGKEIKRTSQLVPESGSSIKIVIASPENDRKDKGNVIEAGDDERQWVPVDDNRVRIVEEK